ncbi:hypothetical protein EV424DRAFT_1412429, partial [Suillus variegatus]
MYIPPFDNTSYSTTTQSPNPSWTYGQRVGATPAGKDWLAGESAGWKVYSTTEMDKKYVTNYPPAISFAINQNATGSLKDTTANLKNGQGFAVNIISEAFIENANSTAVDTPPEFD